MLRGGGGAILTFHSRCQSKKLACGIASAVFHTEVSPAGGHHLTVLIKLRSRACLAHHKHRCRVSARDRIATQRRSAAPGISSSGLFLRGSSAAFCTDIAYLP